MDISRLTDEELLTRAEGLAADERASMCDLIETLSAIDDKKLYRGRGYLSLFEYCVFKLRHSDSAAYRHIRAARAVRIFPPIAALLRSGALPLESVVVLHPYLEDADAASLVAAATGKRVWEVERLVASRRTEAPRRDFVRFIAPALAAPATVPDGSRSLFDPPAAVSAPVPPSSTPAPIETAAVVPLPPSDQTSPPSDESSPAICAPAAVQAMADPANPARETPSSRHAVRIAFTADESFFRLMKEAQAAMRHKYPNGRLDGVFRDALEALLRKKTPWAYRKNR